MKVDKVRDQLEEIEIRDVEELESLLARAYWIETGLEETLEWDAYTMVKEDNRDLIYKLSHDSQGHKGVIERFADKIDGVSKEALKEAGGRSTFKLTQGTQDSELFQELLKREKLVIDIYSRIKENTDDPLVDKIWSGDNQEFFMNLQYLIDEEKKHIDMIEPKVGSIGRIR
ncbi:MAG: hypothetical protein V5A66_03915 [Candidatus Thermoplasmatota archaeon]